MPLAALPAGAEATGMFITDDGGFFFNTQPPSTSNAAPHNVATVGVVTGLNIDELAEDFAELAPPTSNADKQ